MPKRWRRSIIDATRKKESLTLPSRLPAFLFAGRRIRAALLALAFDPCDRPSHPTVHIVASPIQFVAPREGEKIGLHLREVRPHLVPVGFPGLDLLSMSLHHLLAMVGTQLAFAIAMGSGL